MIARTVSLWYSNDWVERGPAWCYKRAEGRDKPAPEPTGGPGMAATDATLLRAIGDFEDKGNTVEEFGELLADATTPPSHSPVGQWRERRRTARCKLRALDGGAEDPEHPV